MPEFAIGNSLFGFSVTYGYGDRQGLGFNLVSAMPELF